MWEQAFLGASRCPHGGSPVREIAAYSVRSVIRNRRATASALIGLVLGVAVVSAPWVALDSSVRGVLDHYLAGLPVDAFAFGDGASLLAPADALRRVPDVERVEPWVDMTARMNLARSGLPEASEPYYVRVEFVAPSFESAAGRLAISGLTLPPPGGIEIHESLLARGLDVGGVVVLELRFPRYDGNRTVVGEDVYDATYNVSGHFRTDSNFGLQDSMFLPLSELPSFQTQLNLTGFFYGGSEYIWVDREALLDPFEPSSSTERLNRAMILMQSAVGGFGFSVKYARSSQGGSLVDIMSSLDSGTLFLRLFFAAFAIPTLVIAWLLSRIGFDIGAPTKRRELAVLRARGLSSRGVKGLLLAESALLSAIAAALGLAIAIALSRLFVVVGIPGVPAFIPTDIAISGGTAIVAFLFALLLAIGAARHAARWLSSEDLVAALKSFHVEEASVPRGPSRDFLLAGVGAAGLILLLAWGSVRDSPLSGLTFVLGFSTGILAPFAPFFLMVALVRYLTRGTTVPYRMLARLLRRWLGELHDLVEKNLVRAPRRSSNAAAIVTLAVAFVVGVSVFASSVEAYREESILRDTPSDVVAESAGYGYFPGVFNASSQASVRAIPGVASVTVVVVAYGNFGTTVLFEASTYLRSVPWLRADHLGGVDPIGLMDELSRADTFAANVAFQKGTGLRVGDVVNLGVLLDVAFAGRLAAIVRDPPGLYVGSRGGDLSASTYVDLAALGSGANLSQAYEGRYLIALGPGGDANAVRDAISGLFAGALYVRTLEEAKEQNAENAIVTATFSYLRVQANVAIVLLAVTVGLFVFSASAERRDEFATIIARGAGTKVVLRLLMAEGWVVASLGIPLGVLAGLLTVATFFALISSVFATSVPFVIPLDLALPLLAVVVGVWLASLSGALAIRRMNVTQVLKLRGG